MSAALIAPIEMPATQSGVCCHRRERLVDAGLVGAERAAALQDEDALLARRGAVAAPLTPRSRPRASAPGSLRHQWRQLSSMRSRRRSRPGQIRSPGPMLSVAMPRLLGAGAQDLGADLDQIARRQRAAGLGADLHRARRLEDVHRRERRGDVLADGQQAVVAQHEEGLAAEVGDQARLFVVAQRDAFVVVIGRGWRGRRSRTARSAARRAFAPRRRRR